MNLKRTVAPAVTPISLAEAKAHLRVTDAAEDDLITAFVAAATDHLDGWGGALGRALVTQTWKLALDGFPAGAIPIPLLPVASVSSVEYRAPSDGSAVALDPSDYRVDLDVQPPQVAPIAGAAWPATQPGSSAATITFVAGYGDASAVPAAIKAAILLIVGDLYANREGQSDRAITPNPTVDRLLAPYRQISI